MHITKKHKVAKSRPILAMKTLTMIIPTLSLTIPTSSKQNIKSK